MTESAPQSEPSSSSAGPVMDANRAVLWAS